MMRAITTLTALILLLLFTSPSSSFLLATARRSHRTQHQSQTFAHGIRLPFSRFRCSSTLAAAKCINHHDCDAENDGDGEQSSSIEQAQQIQQRWPKKPPPVKCTALRREESATRRNALRQMMLMTTSCCTSSVTSPYIASAASTTASSIPSSMVPQNVRETTWPIGKVAFSLLPLAGTYTRRATVKEILVEDNIWTFDQIQGVVNVNVPALFLFFLG